MRVKELQSEIKYAALDLLHKYMSEHGEGISYKIGQSVIDKYGEDPLVKQYLEALKDYNDQFGSSNYKLRQELYYTIMDEYKEDALIINRVLRGWKLSLAQINKNYISLLVDDYPEFVAAFLEWSDLAWPVPKKEVVKAAKRVLLLDIEPRRKERIKFLAGLSL